MSSKIILCMSKNFGIGYKNTLPWNIKEELSYFREKTTFLNDKEKKNCVILGRKTFDSILCYPGNKDGLKDRINIVLTKNKDLKEKYLNHTNIKIVNNFEELEELIEKFKSLNIIETFWYIGGKNIFNYAINKKSDVYLTRINEFYNCDIFLERKIFNKYKIVSKKTKNHFCEVKNKNISLNYFILKY